MEVSNPGTDPSEVDCVEGYRIVDTCVLCGACVPACPEQVIFEGDRIYEIISEKCTKCDECLPVCPVDAILPSLNSPVSSSKSH